MSAAFRALALASLALLSACVSRQPAAAGRSAARASCRRTPAPPGQRARSPGSRRVAPQPIAAADAESALAAFRRSCPVLVKRQRRVRADPARGLGAAVRRGVGAPAGLGRGLFPRFASNGSGSARARPSPPAITSPKSPGRARRGRAIRCRSIESPTISSAARAPDGTTGPRAGRSDGTLRPLLHPRRDRGRRACRARAGARLGGRSDRTVLPPHPGLGPGQAARRQRDADRLCRPERPRICRDRAAASRARPASARRREHGGDRRLDARPARRRPRADARESELHLLQGIDRAGAARRAWRGGVRRTTASPPIRRSSRWARRCS